MEVKKCDVVVYNSLLYIIIMNNSGGGEKIHYHQTIERSVVCKFCEEDDTILGYFGDLLPEY